MQKINQNVNSSYLIPVLLKVLNGSNDSELWDMLKEFDITPKNINQYNDIKHLLEYHYRFIGNHFYKDHVIKDKSFMYDLLRDGLNEYYHAFLKDFWPTIGITDKAYNLLDYGCGDGQYSFHFKYHNPQGSFRLIDKALGIDFIKDPEWYKKDNYPYKYDVILLSEILHCKGEKWQDYLINSSIDLLKPNGCIIINENIDPFMNYRLKNLTDFGGVLDEDNIAEIVNRAKKPLKLWSKHEINYHKIYKYVFTRS